MVKKYIIILVVVLLLLNIVFADEHINGDYVFTVLNAEKDNEGNIVLEIDIPSEIINQECHGDMICIRQQIKGYITEEVILQEHKYALFSKSYIIIPFILIALILILIILNEDYRNISKSLIKSPKLGYKRLKGKIKSQFKKKEN